MSERDAAERFAREIDAHLAGRAANFPEDPEAWSVASRLAGADFAADSRVRESLRAALSLRANRRSRWILGAASGAIAAFAAALALILAGRVREARPLRTATPTAASAQSVFVSVSGGGPFVSAEGRGENILGRRAVVFELNGGIYRLETRDTSLDEIFVTFDPPGADEARLKGGRS